MSAKILIVEDHEDFRRTVKAHLEMQNLDVKIFEASSGELGISAALREKPDIILMDIRLPGIHGIDAAKKIKEHLPDCKIIALTMFESEAFRKVFKSRDIVAYIGKSELHEKLLVHIKKILSKKDRNNQS